MQSCYGCNPSDSCHIENESSTKSAYEAQQNSQAHRSPELDVETVSQLQIEEAQDNMNIMSREQILWHTVVQIKIQVQTTEIVAHLHLRKSAANLAQDCLQPLVLRTCWLYPRLPYCSYREPISDCLDSDVQIGTSSGQLLSERETMTAHELLTDVLSWDV